jgi:hypothetical protein
MDVEYDALRLEGWRGEQGDGRVLVITTRQMQLTLKLCYKCDPNTRPPPGAQAFFAIMYTG